MDFFNLGLRFPLRAKRANELGWLHGVGQNARVDVSMSCVMAMYVVFLLGGVNCLVMVRYGRDLQGK